MFLSSSFCNDVSSTRTESVLIMKLQDIGASFEHFLLGLHGKVPNHDAFTAPSGEGLSKKKLRGER